MPRHTGRTQTAGGLSHKEPFFIVFNNIRKRVNTPTDKDYKNYGGRGIYFMWKDYMEFKEDMYESYLEHKKKYPNNTSIERIDNNSHYCKENCRWATIQDQAKNRRTSRYITHKGETMIIADWARRIGVPRQSVKYRLDLGLTPEQIIEIPYKQKNRFI